MLLKLAKTQHSGSSPPRSTPSPTFWTFPTRPPHATSSPPLGTPPPVPVPTNPAAAITDEILGKALKALPRWSAPGPSGWIYKQIKAATRSSWDARAAVLCLLRANVQGDLPHLPGLLASRLLPIPKPLGGVWPTAISEVRYRLAALCALAACPDGLSPSRLEWESAAAAKWSGMLVASASQQRQAAFQFKSTGGTHAIPSAVIKCSWLWRRDALPCCPLWHRRTGNSAGCTCAGQTMPWCPPNLGFSRVTLFGPCSLP
jgi:hypothetical protein